MLTKNVLDTKTNLSEYIRMIEDGREECILIARYNKPVVKMTRYVPESEKRKLGRGAGRFIIADGWDGEEVNAEVARLFGVE